MITLFADVSGNITYVVLDPHAGATAPALPDGASMSYSFDEQTNTAPVTGIAANLANFQLTNGASGTVLMSGGQAISINPVRPLRLQMLALAHIASLLQAGTSLDAAQTLVFQKFVLSQVLQEF